VVTPTIVSGASVLWLDGLRVTRLTEERGLIWLEIVWRDRPVEVWIGARALSAVRPKRKPLPLEEMGP
jgi:hypothetical protein